MMRLAAAFVVMFLMSASAAAQVTIVHNSTPTVPSYQVDQLHEASAYVIIEYKLQGALVGQHGCYFSCAPTPPVHDEVGYILSFDPARHSIASEVCTGTVLGPGRCSGGTYSVTLNLLTGFPNLVDVGADGLDVDVNVNDVRFHFGEGKYWDGGFAPGTVPFPAGNYTVEFRGAAARHCKPVPRDASVAVTVVPGGGPSPRAEMVFEGTLCQYTWRNDGAHNAVITASTGGSCSLEGDNDECTLEVPFAEDVVFTADAEAGWYGYFDTGSGLCSQLNGSSSSCPVPRAEKDFTTEIRYLDEATAPALIVSAGSAPPADREVAKGSTANAVAHFTVTPRNGTPAIDRIFIAATGTGRPNPHLTQVRVYIDADNDGAYDPGETLVGSGIFGTTTGVASLNVNPTITTATNFVVTVDVNTVLAAAVDLPGAPWSLLLLLAVPVIVLYRRRRALVAVSAVLLVVGAIYACGSDDGGDDQDGDNDQQADIDNTDDDTTDEGGGDAMDNDPTDDDAGDNGPGDNGPGDGDPPPGAVTFGFSVTITGDGPVIVEGGSVSGATITVER